MNDAAKKFKEFFETEKPTGYGQWTNLSTLHPTLKNQLRLFQDTFNVGLANADIDLPTFHVDYVDGEKTDALAFRYGGYSFIAITLKIVFACSDVSNHLSNSALIAQSLNLKYSANSYNSLQGVMVSILLSFVVAHEFSHHKYGHVPDYDSTPTTAQSTMGSSMQQVDELWVDGFALSLLLAHYVERPNAHLDILSALRLYALTCPEEQVLGTIFTAIAGYFLSRPLHKPNFARMFVWEHPLELARLWQLKRVAAVRFSEVKPELELFVSSNFQRLIQTTAIVMLDAEGNQTWQEQIDFLLSAPGEAYYNAPISHIEQERLKAMKLA
jgi:hypothetical protein